MYGTRTAEMSASKQIHNLSWLERLVSVEEENEDVSGGGWTRLASHSTIAAQKLEPDSSQATRWEKEGVTVLGDAFSASSTVMDDVGIFHWYNLPSPENAETVLSPQHRCVKR